MANRYTVRKMVSGRTGVAKFYVYDTVRKGRVTVHAHLTRYAAEADADRLNISDAVRPAAEDPRPYDVRYAESEAAYRRHTPNASKLTAKAGELLLTSAWSGRNALLPEHKHAARELIAEGLLEQRQKSRPTDRLTFVQVTEQGIRMAAQAEADARAEPIFIFRGRASWLMG